MKIKEFAVVLSMVGAMLIAGCVSPSKETAEVYPEIDLSAVPDGVYEGEALYRKFTYRVATTVKDHRITEIQILSNKDSRHGRKAAGVVPLILREQRPDVDGISGATLCSTGLKRAVAESLARSGTAP